MFMEPMNPRRGRFVFIAETLAVLFVFLLPLKFGAVIGIPDITMIYWRELSRLSFRRGLRLCFRHSPPFSWR